MTRKHYVALAEALNAALGYCETQNQRRGVERAARCIAATLAADNGRFDQRRFLAAAGIGAA